MGNDGVNLASSAINLTIGFAVINNGSITDV